MSTVCTPPAPPPPAASPGLSPEQRDELVAARERGRKVRRASVIAAVSGWTLASFGFLSVLVGIFSLTSLIVGLGLSAVAWVELRGARRLRRLDPGAARHLALNQFGLALVLVAYAGWGLYSSIYGPGPYAAEIAGGGPVAETLLPIDRLHRVIAATTYLALVAIGILVPTMTALYYWTRGPHVAAFVRETPSWIVESMRI